MEINPLLGHWTCEQGGRAEVRQTKKQGRHFYTRCECCGLNQGTGKKRQQAIYDNTEFLQGVTVSRPSGVEDKGRVVSEQPEIEPEKLPPPTGDFDPGEVEDDEQPQEADSKPKLLALGAFALALGVGAWLA